jgi:hypothetical protein
MAARIPIGYRSDPSAGTYPEFPSALSPASIVHPALYVFGPLAHVRQRAMKLQAIVAMSLTAFEAACAKPPPPAAFRHAESGLHEPKWERALTNYDQKEVEAAFRGFSEGQPQQDRPLPSETARWEDLPLALDDATDDAEVAVVARLIEADQHTYQLKTTDNVPGTLVIERVHGPHAYRATAHFGRTIRDDQTAQRLLRALAQRMSEAARKRRFASP